MSQIVGGKFHAPGTNRIYICCGFVPDYVHILNVEDPGDSIIWSKYMTLAAAVEGLATADISTQYDLAKTEGIRPYVGGEMLTTTMAGTTTYGSGIYLKPESADWRYGVNLAPGGGSGDGESVTIDTWTLDTPGSQSGHFNANIAAAAVHIAAGSRIQIDGLWYVIGTIAAGAGSAADAVTLNYQAKSGIIEKIEGCYGYTPMIAGEITPAGFTINENSRINSASDMNTFVAMQFDN